MADLRESGQGLSSVDASRTAQRFTPAGLAGPWMELNGGARATPARRRGSRTVVPESIGMR